MAVPEKDCRINDIIDISGLRCDCVLKWMRLSGNGPSIAIDSLQHGKPHPLPDEIIGKVLEVDKMSRNKYLPLAICTDPLVNSHDI
jgi:hypothetical protein